MTRTRSPVIDAFCGQFVDNFEFSGNKSRANYLIFLVGRLSSVVEQRFCKPLVGSSNLSAGTRYQWLSFLQIAEH
jgi:hypothetical protein